MSTKSKSVLEAENRSLRRFHVSQSISSIVNNFVKYGALVLIFRYGYLSIQTLSGQATLADIGIKLLADVRLSETVAWIFGGSGVLYGLRQRKLRRDTVERLEGRIQKFETNLDPKRSSSNLTPRGETRAEDRS